jgi:hypothetical protein
MLKEGMGKVINWDEEDEPTEETYMCEVDDTTTALQCKLGEK